MLKEMAQPKLKFCFHLFKLMSFVLHSSAEPKRDILKDALVVLFLANAKNVDLNGYFTQK